jgi:potassium voltage-gated channel Shab-related subfamily B protein 1
VSPPDFTEPKPDPVTISNHRKQHPKVIINVGGLKHEVMWKMLEKRPLSRLGMLAKTITHEDILNLVDAYSLADNDIYFDRDPATFNCVLNFYRTDRLHVLDEICILDLADDLEFWKIKELNLEICCIDKFNARRERILAELEKEKHTQGEAEVHEDFGNGHFASYQKALWDFFEKPHSSLPAKLISLLSIFLVLVSTVGMWLNTFTWLQAQDVNGDPVDNPYLAMIEAVCISYFSIEYLLRFDGSAWQS